MAYRGEQVVVFADFAQRVAVWLQHWQQHWHSQAPSNTPGRWALHLHDSAEAAAALFGAWYAGATVFLPGDALPATVASLSDQVQGWMVDHPLPGARCLPLPAPSTPALAPAPWPALDPEHLGLVVYTSGSSGTPVALPKRLRQLFDEVATLAACFEPMLAAQFNSSSSPCRVHGTVSHQHVYGLLFRVLWPLAAGRPFDADRLVFPEDIMQRLAHSQSSLLVSSPAHLSRLPQTESAPPASLRALFSSGGPLSAEAWQHSQHRLGLAPLEIYGSSETGGLAWRQRPQADPQTTAWQALPGVDWQVQGEQLQVRSPHLPNSDWHSTPDRVRAVPGGFALLGRQDRLFKIEEKRVSPQAIEQALQASPWVAQAQVLVLAQPRPHLGVVLVPSAAGWDLARTQGKRALNQALRQVLAPSLEASLIPRRWRYLPHLPQNAQGKTTQAALQALFDPRRPEALLRQLDGESAHFELQVRADTPFLAGHFPHSPILPGVTQVEWAMALGRDVFDLPPHFLGMEVLKFQQVIRPGARITLELQYPQNSGRLSFKIHSATGQHASGRLLLGWEAAPWPTESQP